MSGFDLGELLPFYLDETDDQIGVLNDALLQLERDPSDAKALQESFRIVHSIKGSSSVMGFEQVKELTHALESYFDQLRSGRRTLERAALDVCFRCLDDLRDYHRVLRSEGRSTIDLTGSITLVRERLGDSVPPAIVPEVIPDRPMGAEGGASRGVEAAPASKVSTSPDVALRPDDTRGPSSATPSLAGLNEILLGTRERFGLKVIFDPNLQWRDMKAQLVLNRLASKARVLGTDPPVERLEEESPASFTVWLSAECGVDELRALADVDGVAEVRVVDEPLAEGRSNDAALPPVVQTSRTPSPGTATVDPAAESRGVAEAPCSGTAAFAEQAVGIKPPPTAARPRVAETLRVEVDRLDHLMNLAGELVINKARFAQIAGSLGEILRETNTAVLAADAQDRLDGILHGVQVLNATGAIGNGVLNRWEAQFRRLRDNLKVVRGRLEQLGRAQEQLSGLFEAIDQLNGVTQGIQKGVLDTRMVPIGPLFERFRRVIRDLTVTSGKHVELKLSGEGTELDKRMIDELADPLIHMVRNCVDHGLELAHDRVAAGKPPTGTVALQASHRGNSVVIVVSDDGRGIDAERIRRKVVEHGLLGAEEAASLEPRRLIPFIFHPGLSTAERITEISGRGVGMDIVKSRIETLNGGVDVRSEPGRGTTFTIRLPLTLAILPSLLVRIHEESYALALDAIEEIVEVSPHRIHSIHGRRTVDIRGRILSLVALDDVFRWGGSHDPGSRSRKDRLDDARKTQVVVVHNGETTIGLEVDELIGIQEVVLKSLERHFRSVEGLSGASILGDGRVCLILDIDALIGMLDPRAARSRTADRLPEYSERA